MSIESRKGIQRLLFSITDNVFVSCYLPRYGHKIFLFIYFSIICKLHESSDYAFYLYQVILRACPCVKSWKHGLKDKR